MLLTKWWAFWKYDVVMVGKQVLVMRLQSAVAHSSDVGRVIWTEVSRKFEIQTQNPCHKS